MRVQLPDVRVTDFEPDNSTPHMPAPPALRRAVQRYVVALNRVNKLIADVNLSIQLEQLHRRRCKVEDLAQMLDRARVATLVPASIPQMMYVHDELMEVHRGMNGLATLKDTLDNWVISDAQIRPSPPASTASFPVPPFPYPVYSSPFPVSASSSASPPFPVSASSSSSSPPFPVSAAPSARSGQTASASAEEESDA